MSSTDLYVFVLGSTYRRVKLIMACGSPNPKPYFKNCRLVTEETCGFPLVKTIRFFQRSNMKIGKGEVNVCSCLLIL